MIEVPRSFLDQPRWWNGGQDWLAALPELVAEQCRRWDLTPDGLVRHGSNALVVGVRQGDELLALRLSPPDDDIATEAAALTFWAGRGTVRLLAADLERGALLLERLDDGRSLRHLPVLDAAPILGRLMRRLAVPAPDWVPSTADLARSRGGSLVADWERLGRPFDDDILALALSSAALLASTDASVAVNGDLHHDQVLAGQREGWLCVDPVLLRGDIDYDLARVLWYRLDELPDRSAVRECFDLVVRAAALEPERARTWVLLRSVDYWLWGLDHQLTEDPVRCARLIGCFA